MATSREAETFIEQFRLCVDFGVRVQFRRTPKNVQGLIDLNMTEAQAVERVLKFTARDYCRGPEADRDEDGKEIWVFGCSEAGCEVYIKLRLEPATPFSRPVVRSFHPAEFPLTFPHKKGGAP